MLMLRLTVALIIYATNALAPPYALSRAAASVTRAASATKYIKSAGSQSGNRRKRRKRPRGVAHRKPPKRYACPDIVRPMSAAEVEAERKAKEGIRWVTWF